jgi:predicted O-methyltransferase YrrM
MNLRVKRAAFSRLVWEEILEFAEQKANRREQLARINEELEELREQADYNTGTLTMSASWCTFAIGEYFKPQMVVEVGTFIGRSTVAMAWGVTSHHPDAMIYTCDGSNDIQIPAIAHVRSNGGSCIKQYPKTMARDMFADLRASGVRADLAYLDGRLAPDEVDLLRQVTAPGAVIVLDDFEGVEKGVANATQLVRPDSVLVYPPERELLRSYGLRDACSTGLIIPASRLQFVNQ